MSNKVLLQVPPGAAALFLKEASRYRNAIDITQQLYGSWGYTTVHTPMVDFFDAHSHFFNKDEEDRLYRLIGRDGEILMLRSDITVFLIKHYQSLLKNTPLPIRLAYSDSILRHEDSIDISRNEHYQTGVELIGNVDRGDENDLEILFLLCENLRALGIQKPAIHIGSRVLVDAVLANFSVNEERVRECILLRDWNSLREDLFSAGVEQGDAIIAFLSSIREIGGNTKPAAFPITQLPLQMAQRKAIQKGIDYLEANASALKRHFPDFVLRIDASEIGTRHYYSGLTFQVYLPTTPYAIASGGRYDQLLSEMGLNAAATGYSVILSAVLPEEAADYRAPSLSKKFPNSSLEERYITAKNLRKKGESICL